MLPFCSPHVTRSNPVLRVVTNSLAEKDTLWSPHKPQLDSAFRHGQAV